MKATKTAAIDIESLVAEVADRFTEEIKQGRSPTIEEYAECHPEIAHIIRQVFPALDMLNECAGTKRSEVNEDTEVVGVLGDFRILGELGRGGMGVVYEAEQISLGRRVALKVLPFAAMLDKQQLARFKNEARAAATLDHPNIVAIYSVGAERGVHYYAMQLIEGQSLAEIIAELKPGRPTVDGTAPTAALIKQSTSADTAKAALPTLRLNGSAAFSSIPAFESGEYCRAVAQLGIQAAEALDHAHQNGILHRDIKPGNLLLDDMGKLWITDFGLARIEQDAGMTMTGDLLGTLRYMSPEQALANRVVVDHRSDIYSLGVTLYELLTLKPPYGAEDRQELLRQIAFEEPRKPRQINSRLPRDLETIIVKTIEKNPADRYLVASELVDDLQRFLDDQPIKSKPQSFVAIARKWSRRHRPLVWATAATLLVSALVLAGSLGWVARNKQIRQAVVEDKIQLSIDDVKVYYEGDELPAALAALKQAEDLLSTGDTRAEIQDRIGQWQADLRMVQRLEELQLRNFSLFDGRKHEMDFARVFDNYAGAFTEYGLNIVSGNQDEIVAGIRNSSIRRSLVAALDDWADYKTGVRRKQLLSLARAVDDDPWRNKVRDANESNDNAALKALAEEPACMKQPPIRVARLLGSLAMQSASPVEKQSVIELLRKARQAHPTDFWINFYLGRALTPGFSYSLGSSEGRKLRAGEAEGYFRMALSRRPNDVSTRYRFGYLLFSSGKSTEAEAEFREAIRLLPQLGEAYAGLASVLERQGRYDEALESAREGIRCFPGYFENHWALGEILVRQNELAAAAASYREALRLSQNRGTQPFMLHQYGWVLRRMGEVEESDRVFQKVLQIAHDDFVNAESVGGFYATRGKFYEAAEQHKMAFAENPRNHNAGARAACLVLTIEDRQGYEAICQQMLDKFGSTINPIAARRTCLACLISSHPVGDRDQLLRLAEVAVNDPDELYLAYRERALAAYRIGDWAGAKQWAEKGRLARWSNDSEAQNRLIEAMALHQLGKAAEAKASYEKATLQMRFNYPNAPASFSYGMDWNEWLYFELLRREAEALINKNLNSKTSTA